jgi:thiamine biosynthesis lipoprotein
MGVEARIVLHAPSETAAMEAAEAAFARIETLDAVLSDWTARSAASHVSAHAGEGPIAAPPELVDVLAQSLDVARKTEGAFDPTVGPLVALWRRARTLGRMPDPAEIAHARALVGFELVVVDRDAGTVELLRAGMQLDFGAIGKGYACQRAIETLAEKGIASALVQMGGDVVCSDAPPGERGWSIALPATGGTGSERIVLANRALSTSGDTEQHIEIEGVRRSHVIDPRAIAAEPSPKEPTSMPDAPSSMHTPPTSDPKAPTPVPRAHALGLESRCLAIVVGPDGALTDALSTAACVLGAASAPALFARRFPGFEVRFEEVREEL